MLGGPRPHPFGAFSCPAQPRIAPPAPLSGPSVSSGPDPSSGDRTSCTLDFLRATAYNAIARMPRQFRPSVCPSVTRVNCIKTAERIIEILSLSDRPITLVFRHQGSLCKSEGVTLKGGAKYKGVAIFDQYAAVSRKR